MTNKKSGKVMVPAQGGMVRDLLMKIKLILRLMGDSRVNVFIKVLPLAGLIYWLVPFPLDNVIPVVDDAAVVWFSSYLFIELCPPNVVKEHMADLTSNLGDDSGDIVDAETTDVDNDK